MKAGRSNEKGVVTVEALLCLGPAFLLAAVAGLVLWKGLALQLRDHREFQSARAQLLSRLPTGISPSRAAPALRLSTGEP